MQKDIVWTEWKGLKRPDSICLGIDLIPISYSRGIYGKAKKDDGESNGPLSCSGLAYLDMWSRIGA
jgi:hypothetical protein